MFTSADKIRRLAYLSGTDLERIASESGFNDSQFLNPKFLGITNLNYFCYEFGFFHEGVCETGKAFVYEDQDGSIKLEY